MSDKARFVIACVGPNGNLFIGWKVAGTKIEEFEPEELNWILATKYLEG